MRVALIGTRGVPARYGGFETAVEEVGRRLAARGHDVTVYCRTSGAGGPRPARHEGMRLVHLPAVRRKALETFSHTALSVVHAVLRTRPDAAIVFNAANAVFLPALRAGGVPTATHVDGLEWRRAKWGGAGRHYYRMAESLSVRWSDALIADCEGIRRYYLDEFGAGTELITYGAPVLAHPRLDRLQELGLAAGGYHLVVARFEPENHVHLAVEGFRASTAGRPLVVVGGAPYSGDYTRRVQAAAAGDERIRLLGPVWDQELLDALYAGALTYVHGHSVGGTNPSLLRAMAGATATVAFDCVFNHDVLAGDGWFFSTAGELAAALEEAEADTEASLSRGRRLQASASERYDWDRVAERYERLCRRLADGSSERGQATGRRRAETPAPTRTASADEARSPLDPLWRHLSVGGGSGRRGDASAAPRWPHRTTGGAVPGLGRARSAGEAAGGPARSRNR